MKNGILALVLSLGLMTWGQEVLVLIDGSTMEIPGPSTIKGKFLQYYDQDGGLLQLPLKLIDLEKSKAATEALHAAMEAEKDKPEPVAEEPKQKSMTDVSEYVERERGTDDSVPTDVSITNDGISEFRSDNPRSEVQYLETPGVAPEYTASEISKKQGAFKESYNAIQKEIDDLDREIKATEEMIIALQNQLIYGDDPTTGTYDTMERAEEHIKELKEKREKKVEEQKQIDRDARQMGIKNVTRPSKQRTKPERTSGNRLEEYDQDEVSFEYNEEDHPD